MPSRWLKSERQNKYCPAFQGAVQGAVLHLVITSVQQQLIELLAVGSIFPCPQNLAQESVLQLAVFFCHVIQAAV